MNSVADILGYVSIAFSVFFALLVLFSTFKGYRRGVVRQSIRTVTVIVSIIIAIAVIKAYVGIITDACNGNTIAGAIEELGAGALLDSFDPETLDVLKTLQADKVINLVLVPLASLFFPLVFTLLFIVKSAVLYIIYAIICLCVKSLKKKNNTKKTRLLGALVGLVQGFLVATIFFLPINNILDITDTAVNSIKETDSAEASELTEFYDEYVASIYNFPMRTSMTLGGRFLANTVSTVDIDGEPYNTRQPILTIAEVYSDISRLSDASIDRLSKEDQAIIRDVQKKLFEDRFFASSTANLLSSFGDLTDNGLLDFEVEEDLSEFFEAFIGVFKSSTADTVSDDFDTILDVMFFMINENVMDAISSGDEDDVINAMTEKVDYNGKSATALKHIIDIVDSNAHTRPIVTVLTKYSLTLMAEHLSFGEQLDDIYVYIKEDIGRLNDCDSKSDIIKELDSIFAENNINIDDDILVGMTDYVFDEYTSKNKTITEDDMNDIVFSYYDAYVAANAE